ALITTGLALAVWRAGRRLTVLNALAIGLLCAAAVTTKFSGLLLGPIVAVLLVWRALLPEAWPTFWRALATRGEKLLVAVVVLLLAGVISYGG
ncbi:hypothetical protein, partial [Streptomyces sp. CHB19.2]|uniref:hypothetical protein n=1 Tax=Streptomyces sp. CHB19.2 TaxID=2841671 RepID=UPI002095BD63